MGVGIGITDGAGSLQRNPSHPGEVQECVVDVIGIAVVLDMAGGAVIVCE